jgi:hypothetical protein
LASFYAPWWRGNETFGPILYWISTPLYAHYAPAGAGAWLRDGIIAVSGAGFDLADHIVTVGLRLITRVGFLAYAAWETLRLRRVEDLPLTCTRLLLVFLMAVNTWVLPWYFTWPLALASIGNWRSRTGGAALGFAATAPISMYWAQVHFDGMQPSGYVVYLAPLVVVGAAAIWQSTTRWRRTARPSLT